MMPPSGYNLFQADNVVEFLISCGESLISEAIAEGRQPEAALTHEISNIDTLVSSSDFSNLEKSVFALNRAFYSLLATSQPKSFEALRSSLPKMASRIRADLLDVDRRSASLLSSKGSYVT
jgi:hypothetical protein